MDNFFTGSHHNIAHHIGKPNFELLRHDVVEPILLEVRRLCSRCRARPGVTGGRGQRTRDVPLLCAAPPGGCVPRSLGSGSDPARARQVDQIYHLACPASPVHYKYNPVKTIKARAPP